MSQLQDADNWHLFILDSDIESNSSYRTVLQKFSSKHYFPQSYQRNPAEYNTFHYTVILQLGLVIQIVVQPATTSPLHHQQQHYA
mmetsp:Transcript_36977/g.89831  ORF Transcript_36977/g.89831 Transcript_36977/m.89831 type:complete len:85 (+) Transcript_36977:1078-1332(+)